jgi:hypothetical protein
MLAGLTPLDPEGRRLEKREKNPFPKTGGAVGRTRQDQVMALQKRDAARDTKRQKERGFYRICHPLRSKGTNKKLEDQPGGPLVAEQMVYAALSRMQGPHLEAE